MQNTSAFEDRIGYVEILKKLGVGIAQLTYNTQNWVGSGCTRGATAACPISAARSCWR